MRSGQEASQFSKAEGFAADSMGRQVIVEIQPALRRAQIHATHWFHESAYNLMYQAIRSVHRVPGQEYVLTTIQRDSTPVLLALPEFEVVRRVSLADGGGAGRPHFSVPNAVWMTDYDMRLKQLRM